MAFCGNCGNELREGAKFCPKCGNPIIQVIQNNKDGNGKKWMRYGVVAIALIAACYLIGVLGEDKSDDNTSNQKTELTSDASKTSEMEKRDEQQRKEAMREAEEAKRKEAVAEREEEEARRKEEEALRKDEEFRSKIMEHTVQIQEIMKAINNKYNNYVQVGSSGAMNEFSGVHVIGDISDLKSRGDAIFDKMINIARQYNNQDVLNTIRQEKKDFDAQANQMTSNIRKFIYNY